MTTFVTGLLKDNMPVFYYYHNYEHTLYVSKKAIEIGKEENCTEHEIELVSTAALWHDTGYLKTYVNHEEESCLLARQYLPEYGYSNGDIDKMCGMILATRVPQLPKNKLDEIVADADLEYLGTPDAARKAELLFREMRHLDPSLTREKWKKQEISFLESHHYFTRFCKEKKEPLKAGYLQKLINNIE